jgi:hypothetical protein
MQGKISTQPFVKRCISLTSEQDKFIRDESARLRISYSATLQRALDQLRGVNIAVMPPSRAATRRKTKPKD